MVIIALLFIGISSCKSSKAVTSSSKGGSIPTEQIISRHYQNNLGFTTLNVRMRVKLGLKDQSETATLNLRILKDSIIWLSATKIIPLAKLIITPSRASYYEKITKTYYEGSLEDLGKKIGVELNFEQLQNILLGQSPFDLRQESFRSEADTKRYTLIPLREFELYKRLIMLESTHFKLDELELAKTGGNEMLKISYLNYQMAGGMLVPLEIKVESNNDASSIQMWLEYKNVVLNEDIGFPYETPEDFKLLSF